MFWFRNKKIKFLVLTLNLRPENSNIRPPDKGDNCILLILLFLIKKVCCGNSKLSHYEMVLLSSKKTYILINE